VKRDEWLRGVRRRKVERYDAMHAPTYDEQWGAIGPVHRQFVERVARSVPEGGLVLDAACGTGRFFPTILDAGRRVFGVDASAGMLAAAAHKHPDVPTERRRLEALGHEGEFDAAICVDALENLPPEDWPAALTALRRSVRDTGVVYLTVELPDPAELQDARTSALAAGLPVVDGELAHADGGYHYYPTRTRVLDWLAAAELAVEEERESDGYWHLLCRPAADRSSPRGASVRTLAAGVVGAVALGFAVLLLAGSFGAAGVVGAAVLEAAAIYGLYRWSPA
jgi:SAM-dependent methyltransferase